MTPVLSVEAPHVTVTANPEAAVAVIPVGTEGGVKSVFGPRRLVPNPASSKSASHVPVAVSPIWSWAIEVATMAVAELERPVTSEPSSQTSTVLAAPLSPRCSSNECHPAPTRAVLIELVAVASLWKPR